MAGLVDLAVGKAGAEALGIVEAVEVDLRLRVVVRGIGGPLAGVVQHLSQNHIGEGGVVVVEKGFDLPLHAAQQLAAAPGVLGLDGVGGVHDGREGLVVQGFLNVELTVGLGGEGDLGAPARQQAVGLVVEAVGPVGLAGLSVPGVGHLAGEEQHGDFLLRLVKGKDVAGLHYQQAHVHLGAHVVRRHVDVGIVALFELVVLAEIGHWSHLRI